MRCPSDTTPGADSPVPAHRHRRRSSVHRQLCPPSDYGWRMLSWCRYRAAPDPAPYPPRRRNSIPRYSPCSPKSRSDHRCLFPGAPHHLRKNSKDEYSPYSTGSESVHTPLEACSEVPGSDCTAQSATPARKGNPYRPWEIARGCIPQISLAYHPRFQFCMNGTGGCVFLCLRFRRSHNPSVLVSDP